MPVGLNVGSELQFRHGIVDFHRLIGPFHRGDGLRESEKRQTRQQAGCQQDANILHIRLFYSKKIKLQRYKIFTKIQKTKSHKLSFFYPTVYQIKKNIPLQPENTFTNQFINKK